MAPLHQISALSQLSLSYLSAISRLSLGYLSAISRLLHHLVGDADGAARSATDVAARGLDIPNVTAVINYGAQTREASRGPLSLQTKRAALSHLRLYCRPAQTSRTAWRTTCTALGARPERVSAVSPLV